MQGYPRGRTIEEHRVLLELREKAYSIKSNIQKKKLNSRKFMSITLTNTRKIDKYIGMIYVWGWAIATIELEVLRIMTLMLSCKPLSQNMFTTKKIYGEERFWKIGLRYNFYGDHENICIYNINQFARPLWSIW